MGTDRHKNLRILRQTLTCLLLFLLTWYYQVPERIWSIITVWVVMTEYTSVGGVFKKSFYRFSGTFLSAVYGIVIIYCFENNVLINMIAFAAGVFVYMYYFLDSDKTYIAVIGSVTLSIVLLNHNDLDAAILRAFNILIGILASMFMIRFFYPKYARDDLIEAQVNFIKQLMSILESYLDKSKTLTTVKTDYLQYEQKILKGLSSFDSHISEAKIETNHCSGFISANMTAKEHIRHLFQLLSVYINYLTTDEIRADKWSDQQLSQLLLALRAIQCKLTHNEMDVPIHSMPLSKSRMKNDQNTQPIHIILTTLHKEVDMLNKEINKLILGYDKDSVDNNTPFWRRKRGVSSG